MTCEAIYITCASIKDTVGVDYTVILLCLYETTKENLCHFEHEMDYNRIETFGQEIRTDEAPLDDAVL